MQDVIQDMIVWLGTFLGIASSILAISRLFLRNQTRQLDRLDGVRNLNSDRESSDETVASWRDLHESAPWLSETLPVTEEQEKEFADIARSAGDYRPGAGRYLLALRAACTLVPLAVGIMWTASSENFSLRGLTWGLVGGLIGFALPAIVMSSRGKQRVNRLRRSIPDALDSLVMCLEAGLPLPASLKRTGDQLKYSCPELALEMQLASRQAELGRMQQAFFEFGKRLNTEEAQSLAAVIAHCDRLGTDPAPALRGFSRSLRIESRQRADSQANKAATKLLFPMTLCLAPAFYIMMLGPAIIDLATYFRARNDSRAASARSIGDALDAGFRTDGGR